VPSLLHSTQGELQGSRVVKVRVEHLMALGTKPQLDRLSETPNQQHSYIPALNCVLYTILLVLILADESKNWHDATSPSFCRL